MAVIKSGLAMGAVFAAGLAYAVSQQPAQTETTAVAAFASDSYRVVVAGADTGCEVTLADSAAAVKARLVFGAHCAEEVPQLSRARFWNERSDGAIAFTEADGRLAMQFAAGDGIDYEAFGDGAPLVSLVSAGE